MCPELARGLPGAGAGGGGPERPKERARCVPRLSVKEGRCPRSFRGPRRTGGQRGRPPQAYSRAGSICHFLLCRFTPPLLLPGAVDWPPPSGPRLCFSLGRTFGGGGGRSSLSISARESDSLHFPFSRGQCRSCPLHEGQRAPCAPALGRAGSCAPRWAGGSAENEIRGLKLCFKN